MGKKLAVFIMACCIVMTGCTDSGREKQVNSENTKFRDNPFKSSEGQEIVEAAYGWKITNYDSGKRVIPYDGKGLKLEIEVDNQGAACELGFLFFIDGIAQKYKAGEENTEAYIHPLQFGESAKKKVQIEFKPEFATDGNEHEMYVASMFYPSYRVSKENMGYGNYGNITPCMPWKIEYAVKNGTDYTDSMAVYKDLTEEIRQQYMEQSNNGTMKNKLDMLLVTKYIQQDEIIENGKIDVSKDLTLQIYGGENRKYRLCAMVNNMPVKVFGGKTYCDIVIEEGRMAEVTVGFQECSGIENYSPLYFVLCPADEKGFNADLLMEKSKSAFFVRK